MEFNGKIKENNYIEIILELQKDSFYKPSNITSYLTKKFPDLGSELILPIDTSFNNIPFFIFQQNPNFKIWGNFFNIVITVYDEYKEKINEILKSIFEIFNNNAKFYAIALTFDEKIENNKIKSFEKKFFNKDILLNNDTFRMTLLRNIKIDGKDVQCIEGYSTIEDNFISHFEFHFKRNSYKELSYENVLRIMNDAIKYKEQKKFK